MTDENRKRNARLEFEKAEVSLRAAHALHGLGLWDDAVSRAYYAAFHAASAALLSEGVQSRTHVGTHDLFFQSFVATGVVNRTLSKDIAALQRYREQADHSITVHFDAPSSAEEVARAQNVVATLRTVLVERGVLGTPVR